MNYSDLYNGLFEGVSALFAGINIYRIVKDKIVKGVSVLPMIFFVSWGYFNLWFYPHNGLWLSFAGGCVMCLVNTTWIMLYFKYKNKS